MKKYILTILFFSLCLQVLSQETYLSRHKPQNTNGYLVLENNFQVGIRYWTIEIIINFYEDFELVNQEVIERYDLIGKNYLQIPQEFLTMDNVSAKITAFFQNDTFIEDEIAISTQIEGGPDYEYYQDFTCVGYTYAYELVHFKHKTLTKSYLQLSPTAKEIDIPVVYYYEYYPQTAWSPTLYYGLKGDNIPFWFYHNLGNNFYFWAYSDLLDVVIKPNPPSNGIFYKDGGGYAITSPTVVGVKKYTGPWCGYNLTLQDICTRTSVIQTISVTDLQHAITLFNQHASPQTCGLPVLSCENLPSTNYFEGLDDNIANWMKEINAAIDEWVDISDWLDSILTYPLVGADGSAIEPEHITISMISGIGNTILNVPVSDLYDQNGDFVQIPIQLDEGLYRISILFENGIILSIVKEMRTENNTFSLSNQLNVTIFPVPIQGNCFEMNLQALQNLKVEYMLYDFNGNLIFSTNIDINEGCSEPIVIQPAEGIPSGFLVNVFYFEDGSQLNLLTVKYE